MQIWKFIKWVVLFYRLTPTQRVEVIKSRYSERKGSMSQVIFDNKGQLGRIEKYLIPGEKLYAVFDCKGGGTGFVGITDRRVIFYDQGVLFKKKNMVSIPYNQVIGVASADEGMIFQKSEINLITAAGKFSFIFRGGDKAHKAYTYILSQILGQATPQLAG